MALGVVWIIVGQFASGAWFIVIGWFLRNVSESSYRQLLFQSTLGGTTVGEVVNRTFQAAPPDIPLAQMVNDHMLGQGQRCVPIVAGEELLGLVTIADLKRVPQEQWGTTSTYRAMTPKERLHVASPRDDVAMALEMMATHDIHQMPVVEGRTFLGFVTRADVLRLMQVRSELAGTTPGTARA